MSDVFLAEIRIFPFNFAPTGWAMCDGQLLPINQYTAVFSLIGTFYGGNGITNFALPNLQGSVPIDFGSGPGLTARDLGETGGEASHTLLTSEIPAHNHNFYARTSEGSISSPSDNMLAVPAISPRFPNQLYTASVPNTPTLAGDVIATGGGQPHNNLQPYLVLNFCIALQGIFPSRG
jgi:microcystin-dependent protein